VRITASECGGEQKVKLSGGHNCDRHFSFPGASSDGKGMPTCLAERIDYVDICYFTFTVIICSSLDLV
jgi:hypothetical protein